MDCSSKMGLRLQVYQEVHMVHIYDLLRESQARFLGSGHTGEFT